MGTFTISFQGDAEALVNLATALKAIADLIVENQQGKVDVLTTQVTGAVSRLRESNHKLHTAVEEQEK